MKIRLPTEKLTPDLVWLAEWGFSEWIEYTDERMPFDTDFSDAYLKNA